MASLREHLLIVLRGAEMPLCTLQMAAILRLPPESIASQISKLRYYGDIELVQEATYCGAKRRFYQIKEKEPA